MLDYLVSFMPWIGVALAFVPIIGFVALMFFLGRRKFVEISVAAVFLIVTILAGVWAVDYARNNTLAISIVALPGYGTIVAFFGALSIHLIKQQRKQFIICGWASLIVALIMIISLIISGFEGRARHEKEYALIAQESAAKLTKREKYVDLQRKDLELQKEAMNDVKELVNIVNANRENPTAAIEAELDKRNGERDFLAAALSLKLLSPETIEKFSHTDDILIKRLMAANRRTSTQMLEDFYANDPNKYYLDCLAINPSAPPHILNEIAVSTEPVVLQNLLNNPSIDCATLEKIKGSIEKLDEPQSLRSNLAALADQREPLLCKSQ